jgi:sec-independent protein translocase protein TatC
MGEHEIDDDPDNTLGTRKTFMEHLLELRARLFVCLFVVLACTIAAWVFWGQIGAIIVRPVEEHNKSLPVEEHVELIITAPMEAFSAVLRIGLWTGLVLALPIILWEIWRFVSPGLFRRERFALIPMLLMGPFLFAAGVWFAYEFIFPIGMRYLLSFAPELGVLSKLSLSNYMRFFVMIHVAFGLAFETPLLILALARLGFVTPGGLVRSSRYVIVGAFVLGAVLTPPDVVTQVMMAGVLIVLYFGSIVIAWAFGTKRGAPDDEADESSRTRARADDPHS